MPKDAKTYDLFIAAPSDISGEKEIIKSLCAEWNRIQGRSKNARIEILDWEYAYPMSGKRPQQIINEQLFDESDFVVAIFWTKFGTPSGVAKSGTEEEILRAHAQGKPLLLYFSDKEINPSLIFSEEYGRVVDFRRSQKDNSLYHVFNTDENFREKFRYHLSAFMNDLLNGKYDEVNAVVAEGVSTEPQKENDETGANYQSAKRIEELIKSNFNNYCNKLLNFDSSFHDDIRKKDALKAKIDEWEYKVREYTNSFDELFMSRFSEYEEDEFKNEIFATQLWTVEGALSNKDRELRRYKKAFKKAEGYEIKEIVQNILDVGSAYNNNPPNKILTGTVEDPIDFCFEDHLTIKPTLLKNVIGKGIRSEILHKAYPSYFSLMTRRSIWGLFFLSSESLEFIVDESKDGLCRRVHNWDYLYDHFNYYNYKVFALLNDYAKQFGLELQEKYSLGYVNIFLVEIFQSHAIEIENYRTYKNCE